MRTGCDSSKIKFFIKKFQEDINIYNKYFISSWSYISIICKILSKIYGKYYPILAKILEIEGLSAHGDQNDLLNWLSDIKKKPEKVFLVHGENQPADELRIKINEKYGFDCAVPLMGQEIEL